MKKSNLLILPISFAVFFTACDLEVTDNIPDEGSLVGSWTVVSLKTYENADCSGSGTSIPVSGSVTYSATAVTGSLSQNWTLSSWCGVADGTMDGDTCRLGSDNQLAFGADEWAAICVGTEEGGLSGTLSSSGSCDIELLHPGTTYTYDAATGVYTQTDSDGTTTWNASVNGSQLRLTIATGDSSCMSWVMNYDLQ